MSKRQVKGSHVVQLKEWIERHLGSGTFASMVKGAGEEWRVVLPVAWYDVRVVNDLMEEAARRAGARLEDISTEVCRLNAERDLTSLYKFFMRAAKPQLVLEQTPRLWRTYVNFAQANAVKNTKGHYVGQGSGFTPDLLDWACGCWRGFIPAAIEVAGGRNLNARISSRRREANGTYSVTFEVHYH